MFLNLNFQKAAKFDVNQAKAAFTWIGEIVGEPCEQGYGSASEVKESLGDGQVLCKSVKKLL